MYGQTTDDDTSWWVAVSHPSVAHTVFYAEARRQWEARMAFSRQFIPSQSAVIGWKGDKSTTGRRHRVGRE